MKKLIYALGLCAALLAFTSCFNSAPTPYADARFNDGTLINNLDSYDPTKIEYIELTFDQPMDTSHDSILPYYFEDPISDSSYTLLRCEWKNNYTYRIYLYLLYGHEYKYTWNDIDNVSKYYTKADNFFRSKAGAYAEFNYVQFYTDKSPNAEETQNYEIDFDYKVTVPLKYNKTDDNQQCLYVNFTQDLNHDYLRPGDTVTINYKVTSEDDITPIKVRLFENTDLANKYDNTILSDDAFNLVPETFKAGDEYSGSLTFTAVKRMIDRLDFQFYAPSTEDGTCYTFSFMPLE